MFLLTISAAALKALTIHGGCGIWRHRRRYAIKKDTVKKCTVQRSRMMELQPVLGKSTLPVSCCDIPCWELVFNSFSDIKTKPNYLMHINTRYSFLSNVQCCYEFSGISWDTPLLQCVPRYPRGIMLSVNEPDFSGLKNIVSLLVTECCN